MSIQIASDKNYRELTGEGFSIVDFYSTTCVPCKMLARILEEVALDLPFLNIVKVNISNYPALGTEHQVEAVPTVLFVKDGEEAERQVGLMSEAEILEKISQHYYGMKEILQK